MFYHRVSCTVDFNAAFSEEITPGSEDTAPRILCNSVIAILLGHLPWDDRPLMLSVLGYLYWNFGPGTAKLYRR